MINEDISKLDIDDVFNEYKNIDVTTLSRIFSKREKKNNG